MCSENKIAPRDKHNNKMAEGDHSLSKKSKNEPEEETVQHHNQGFRFSEDPSLEKIQWKGEVKEGLSDFTDKERIHVGHEMSDVLLYLVRLADRCHIDLPSVVLKKMEQNRQKYPADIVYGKSDKYTEYQ
ncbi:dCTP pyrophosphatase 1-like isoform X3 [Mizuhopecten yessoensis]|uniref:dCTP pyrophosphatase 1-like isoform X3 n=1 Tax=Mizuhopecten yessoensis TaxID=6573 RepID=UPI000B458646|nr:dCTP pyrophosphatase 1-like isoform X3 [Mizuhopecten yessoensis]